MPASYSNSTTIQLPGDTVIAGSNFNPKFDTVSTSIGSYTAPVARRVWSHMQWVCATGAAGGPASAMLDFLTSIVWKDDTGERGNLTSGRTWRNLLQTEFGVWHHDGTDIAPNTATVYVEMDYMHPFIPRKCAREADFYIPMTDFRNGWVKFNTGPAAFGPANTWTFTSGTHFLMLDVVDEGVLEAKCRIVWRDIALINADASYEMNGNLMAAYYYNGVANQQAGTTIALVNNYSQMVTSKTLDYSQIPAEYFKNLYRQFTAPRFADSTGDRQDPVAGGYMIPFYTRAELAPLSDTPIAKSIHYKTDGAVTANTDKIVIGYVEPRTPKHTAGQLRVREDAIASAIQAGGYLPTANGKKMYMNNLKGNQALSSGDSPAWRLPIRLDSKVAEQYAAR